MGIVMLAKGAFGIQMPGTSWIEYETWRVAWKE
jgi:hypothetical protein